MRVGHLSYQHLHGGSLMLLSHLAPWEDPNGGRWPLFIQAPSLNIPIGPVDSESVSLSSSQLSLLTHWRIFSNKPDYVPSHA